MRLKAYINAIYSLSEYGVAVLTRRVRLTPMPFAVSIELTNMCNLRCPCCATGAGLLTRPRGFMRTDMVENKADSLKRYTLAANLYFQGEPMLHPHFFEITERLRYLRGTISTNGHFLSEENCKRLAVSGLKKIIVSYDGMTQEVYSSYRQGGNHSVVKEGIRCLAAELNKQKNAPALELLFLYGRHNSQEMKSAKKFASSVKASFKVKSMQVTGTENIDKWIPDEARISRYIKDEDTYRLKKGPVRGCMRMWTTAVITWDGNVVPCCYDKDAIHNFGNIYEKPFNEIWNGDERHTFITNVIRERDSYEMCKTCPQGLRLFFR
jgi:radical SAM protein with 4Fe4S-binding SPASM domain